MSDRSVRKLDEGARNRFSSSRLVQLLQQWHLLRTLQHMRECSPGYFHRFVSHLETLQWLQLDSLLAHDIQRPGPGIKSRQGARPSKPRPSRR